jgi:hypothetical protein
MTNNIMRARQPSQAGDCEGAYSRPEANDVRATMRTRLARQPAQGLSGLLLLVIPVAAVLAFVVDGAQGSTIVIGPLAVFALAPTAMIAFWWEGWPGSRLRPSWSGWADTLLIAVIAVAMTIVGQRLVGHVDLRGVFSLNPGPAHSPVFPFTLPMAGAAFVAIMQLTFVCERWPFERLSPIVGGVAALVTAWVIALLLFFGLVGFHAPPDSTLRTQSGPFTPADLGALLVLTGVWQIWFYISWQGWPFTTLTGRSMRLLIGNAVVIGAAIATFLLAEAAGLSSVTMIALAGSFIAAALLLGLLFDGWLPASPKPSSARLITIALDLALAAILYVAINAYANRLQWTIAKPTEWVAHVMLNAIAFSVILHVAIGRRWPLPEDAIEGGRPS